MGSSDNTDNTRSALGRLLDRYLETCQRELGSYPKQAHEAQWPSLCQIGAPDSKGDISWRPVQRSNTADFSGLEHALATELHPSIKAYYGSYWCDSFQARTDEGGLTLIQIWNEKDFGRLIENILGHALAKQRIKSPLTVFFACTDEDELMLSVDNASGRVVLEAPGSAPLRDIAPALDQYLDRVTPIASGHQDK